MRPLCGLAVLASVALAAGCGTAGPRPGGEPPPVPQPREEAASLTVRVIGLPPKGGEVALALYATAESFAARRDPVAKTRLPSDGGEVTWELTDLVPGRYAVAAYHDADGDGELDRGVGGWPSESYGFSNDARGRLGPPDFESAALSLLPGENRIEIRVR